MGNSDNSGKWGDYSTGLGGLVPLPGFTEVFQYKVLKNMGLTDVDASNLPFGNPNLIREAKQRKTLGNNKGSTLMAKFNIKMTVDYELKYYPGVDPTLVYLDIITNALSFGTSEAYFQLNNNASTEMNAFLSDIASGDAQRVKKAVLLFVRATADAIISVANELKNYLVGLVNSVKSSSSSNSNTTTNTTDPNQKGVDAMGVIITKVANTGAEIIQSVINKYRVKILGVINSLTGQPSAPWHVTIGNPKRPIFSSGDMLVEEVELSMGKTLGFNDIPTSVRLSFTLTNARNLGAQEVFRKFNCGKGRSYIKVPHSFIETDQKITNEDYSAATKQLQANREKINQQLKAQQQQNIAAANSQVLQSGQTASTRQTPVNVSVPNGYVNIPPSLTSITKRI